MIDGEVDVRVWKAGRRAAVAVAPLWVGGAVAAGTSVNWVLGLAMVALSPGPMLLACYLVEHGLASASDRPEPLEAQRAVL